MKTIFTIAVGLFVLHTTIAFGQIGGLDTTFGQGGTVSTYINGVSEGLAEALQTDGKIVVAGFTFDSTKDVFATLRYDTDGAIDTNFAVEGIDTISFQNGNNIATSVAIQKNGRIIVAGYAAKRITKTDSVVKSYIIRYNTDGSPDTTFGTKGVAIDSIGNTDTRILAMAIQPDGKIVVTGSTILKGATSKITVLRYDSTGIIDTSFNDSGVVTISVGNLVIGTAISFQPNGKILVAATDGSYGNYNAIIIRYDTNGKPDTTFGRKGNGVADTMINNGLSAYSIALQSNGNILVGGHTLSTQNSVAQNFFAISRCDSGGRWNKFIKTKITNYDNEIRGLAIDTAGRIVAVGFARDSLTSYYDFALARYDSTLLIDTSFNDTIGSVVTGFGTSNTYGNSVLLQPDGKIVAAGYSLVGAKGLFALARYLITRRVIVIGAIDFITENNSLFIYPNPVESEATLKYTLQKNESVTLGIYDVLGRAVQTIFTNESKTPGNYTEQIDLGALPPGVYILNLSNNNAQNLNIKIVKQ